MRWHVEVIAVGHIHRAHVVDECEWPHHAFAVEGEQAANEEVAHISGAFFDDEVDVGHGKGNVEMRKM
jgi:hypothetical protein